MTDTAPAEVRQAQTDPKHAFGKYVLVSLLGKGGMGEVWRAWDTALSRWVAVKFLSPGGSDEDLERFRREALAVARLAHANIAAVYDAGEIDGRRYIAMQFVDGRTLAKVCIPLPRALEAIRDAARAVHYAHEQGVIHRDIKPSNLLLDHDGRVFLIDFGISRSSQTPGTLSKSDIILGTPPFMSPEQAVGSRNLDARTDVYSLGATLYALVTGRNPFVGDVSSDMLLRVIHHDPLLPRKVRPDIPRDVETILLKAMDKDPRRRYSSAGLLADDLGRYLAGEPIYAHPPSAWYRLSKALAKRKALVGAVLAGVAAAAVCLAILIPWWSKERARAEKEEHDRIEAQRTQQAMQQLNILWARVVTAREWTRQAYRQGSEIRAEYAGAERDLTEFIRANPDMPQGWYLRSRARMYLWNLDGAEEDLKRTTTLREDFAPGWILLGQLYVERYQRERASPREGHEKRVREADRYIRQAEEAIRKGWSLGTADDRWGLPKTREDAVAKIVATALKETYVDGKIQAAYDRLERAQNESASEEYCQWLALWTSDRGMQARLLDTAIKIAPHCMMPYYVRAVQRRNSGDHEGAIGDYSKALEMDPFFVPAYCDRGNAYWQIGDRKKAMEDYDRAVEIAPQLKICHEIRGRAHRIMRNFEAALQDYAKAIELDPKDASLLFERGIVRQDSGDPAGALKDYAAAIDLDSRCKEAYQARGMLLRDMGDSLGAIKDLSQAIEIDPKWPDPLANRGATYFDVGQYDEAVVDLRKALELAPAGWPHRKPLEDLLEKAVEAAGTE